MAKNFWAIEQTKGRGKGRLVGARGNMDMPPILFTKERDAKSYIEDYLHDDYGDHPVKVQIVKVKEGR